jgi:hypothetical protein
MSKEDINMIKTEDQLKEKYKLFTNLVLNEPLIEQKPTLEATSYAALESNTEGSIYYGTGLTTPRAIGVGLPFDVLGMILVAERIKRSLGLKEIYHHIADTHAKTNEWIDSKEVDRRAKTVEQTLLRVASNLQLSGFNVALSSSFDKSSDYEDLVKHFKEKSQTHEYVIREMADMEWYRTKHRTSVKMGWIIQATEAPAGFDERLFDQEYKKIEGEKLSFVYTKPGRTLDLNRPKASPYIQIAGENRILLEKGENVTAKMLEASVRMKDPNLGGSKKQIENIVRVYEKLFGAFGRVPLEEKVQAIIDKATL